MLQRLLYGEYNLNIDAGNMPDKKYGASKFE